ncbi:MAG: hypothetical protein P4L45_14105 [Ignavibacteriaceae bacterium]|nr:hypothetical protein [Ignavibacteriaceae bacterium]
MIELNDEILNKYLDGELNGTELNEIRERLKNSEHDRLRLAMLQKVHSELGRLEAFKLPDDFTSLVMSKVQKEAKYAQKDRFFVFSVFSVFFIIIAGIIGYLLVLSIHSTGGSTQDVQNFNNYVNFVTVLSGSIKELMTPKNISVIGSILSFGVIISGYLFFENQRQSRRNLSKLR